MQSGYIGEIPRIVTFDWIGRRFKFEDQKFAGLPIRVDYEGTQYVSINPLEPNTQIVFPNAGLINVTAETNLWLTNGTLTPGNLYYLYLKQGEGITSSFGGGNADTSKYYFSTEVPTKSYTNLWTKASFTVYDRQDSTYYALGTCIYPPSGTSSEMYKFYFKCVQAGTTAASIDPNIFNVDVYEDVTDGGCKWKCMYDIHDSVAVAKIAPTATNTMSGAQCFTPLYGSIAPSEYNGNVGVTIPTVTSNGDTNVSGLIVFSHTNLSVISCGLKSDTVSTFQITGISPGGLYTGLSVTFTGEKTGWVYSGQNNIGNGPYYITVFITNTIVNTIKDVNNIITGFVLRRSITSTFFQSGVGVSMSASGASVDYSLQK